MTSESSPVTTPSRTRRGGLAVALWGFGLFTTVLLVGVWGRSITSDAATIEAGAQAVLDSDVVSERVTDWIAGGIEESTEELPVTVATDVAVAVWTRTETRAVVSTAISTFVEAALSPAGTTVPIDLGELLRPLVPVVVEELSSRGILLNADLIESAISEVPSVVLGTDGDETIVAAISRARAALTKVAGVALVGMIVTAAAAVFLAEERMRQVRALAIRVAVSAATFVILLRFSAWALDPGGGRSPLAAGGAILLSSSGHVLVLAAMIAVGVAFFVTVGARRQRSAAV